MSNRWLAPEAVESYLIAKLSSEQFIQDADKAWQHYFLNRVNQSQIV